MRNYERVGVDRFLFGPSRVFIKMNLTTGSRDLYMENSVNPPLRGQPQGALAGGGSPPKSPPPTFFNSTPAEPCRGTRGPVCGRVFIHPSLPFPVRFRERGFSVLSRCKKTDGSREALPVSCC